MEEQYKSWLVARILSDNPEGSAGRERMSSNLKELDVLILANYIGEIVTSMSFIYFFVTKSRQMMFIDDKLKFSIDVLSRLAKELKIERDFSIQKTDSPKEGGEDKVL